MATKHTTDVCIIGSGFAGSLTAWALSRHGRRVALIDKQSHPRFAIGESSTPLADFLLREIGQRFDLPEVLPLCTWGTWRKNYPLLRCGKKRGFSYFQHQPGREFTESNEHENSYLVAATASDAHSDTHWMRSDVDAWLFDQARRAGTLTFESAAVTELRRDGQGWAVSFDGRDGPIEIASQFLVDSTGTGAMLARQVGIERSRELRTNTAAVYGHFRDVASMSDTLGNTEDDPFDSDDAAQHHLLSDSLWCWMLRFCDGTTSVGLTGPAGQFAIVNDQASASEFWDVQSRQYPTLGNLLSRAELVAPVAGLSPSLGWVQNISRSWNAAAGSNWAMLPTTAGIVDPMHSTGIAHSLSGVWRMLDILISARPSGESLAEYSQSVVDEVRWIDLLVALSHRSMRISMDVFVAASSFYFVAAVHSERQMAEQWKAWRPTKGGFLLAGSKDLRRLAASALERLIALEASSTKDAQVQFVEWVREQLRPWNDFGLLEPECRNRIWRSTIEKAPD